MCLFRADSSHGKVFKDIQINKELKRLIGRDHQLLHLYVNVQQDMATKGEIPEDEEDELTEEDLADGDSDVLDHSTWAPSLSRVIMMCWIIVGEHLVYHVS